MAEDPQRLHPLEPLSQMEITAAVRLVKGDLRSTDTCRFVSATLREPPKGLDQTPGGPRSREAFLILSDSVGDGGCSEVVVSLTENQVISWRLVEGVQSAIMADEFIECEEAVKRSPEFREALKKRGVEDVNLVMVDPWSAGWYGNEPEEDNGRRLSRALASVRSEPFDNGYARPLQGVVAIVDLGTMEVLRVEDYGVVPLPPDPGNWTSRYITPRPALKPLEVVQDEGPDFVVDGHHVRWHNWRFRIGFTPREGLVLYTVGYEDGGLVRPILYRASLCDMVVPYGDPGPTAYHKNAFDVGEYGIGELANTLTLGCDCLGHIHYFDASMTNSQGRVSTIENAVCLHEEDDGLLWKHTDWRTEEVEVRRSRRLVVSFIATVGNYEYGFYWYFYLDGSIELELRLTGVLNTTALHPGEESKYGTKIAPQLLGPHHQHIFNVRLDMSVDGDANSVYEVNSVTLPRGEDNPHGNAFSTEETRFETEADAGRLCNTASSRYWKIVNESVLNRLGRPVGYRLVPGENCIPLVTGRRFGCSAGRLSAASSLGHSLQPGRELRSGGLSESASRYRWCGGLDEGRSSDRRHRSRRLVHVWPYSRSAARRMASDGGPQDRFHAEAGRLFRRQSVAGSGVVNIEGILLLELIRPRD